MQKSKLRQIGLVIVVAAAVAGLGLATLNSPLVMPGASAVAPSGVSGHCWFHCQFDVWKIQGRYDIWKWAGRY